MFLFLLDVQALRKKSGHDPLVLLLNCLTSYTRLSEDVCTGLARSGVICNLGDILQASQQVGVLCEVSDSYHTLK